jgi:hypothetical protein
VTSGLAIGPAVGRSSVVIGSAPLGGSPVGPIADGYFWVPIVGGGTGRA